MLFCMALFAKQINKNNQKQTNKEENKKEKKTFQQFETTTDNSLACFCTLAQKCIYILYSDRFWQPGTDTLSMAMS